jgi:hypothetical protein
MDDSLIWQRIPIQDSSFPFAYQLSLKVPERNRYLHLKNLTPSLAGSERLLWVASPSIWFTVPSGLQWVKKKTGKERNKAIDKCGRGKRKKGKLIENKKDQWKVRFMLWRTKFCEERQPRQWWEGEGIRSDYGNGLGLDNPLGPSLTSTLFFFFDYLTFAFLAISIHQAPKREGKNK